MEFPSRNKEFEEAMNLEFVKLSTNQKFEEASKEEVWRKVMDEGIKMIEKNHTWELMQKPEDKEIIGLKWVYKIKYNEDGTIQKHKA